jgi:predicted nucleic acid-binding protein
MPYLDTSVLTAYCRREPRSELVQARLCELTDPVISPLVEVEFHCAVARQVRAGTSSHEAAEAIFRLFSDHLARSHYRVVPIGGAHYRRARDWLARLSTPLRVLDALHLAVAEANGLALITADQALAQVAAAFHIEHELLP